MSQALKKKKKNIDSTLTHDQRSLIQTILSQILYTKSLPILPDMVHINFLCRLLIPRLAVQDNLLQLSSPISVVGDLHGSLLDLKEIFSMAGPCPQSTFLFLGNYINRGSFSLELLVCLMCLKLLHPTRIYMLRGNHDCRRMAKLYGFHVELLRKQGTGANWDFIMDFFDCLPLAALVNKNILCLHGGFGPEMKSLAQIHNFNRFQEIPESGFMTDILWSNPSPRNGKSIEPSSNSPGHAFTSNSVTKYCTANNLVHIFRGNQLCIDGYQTIYSNKLSTIWSVSNFLGTWDNCGCFVEIQRNGKWSFHTFTCKLSENAKMFHEIENADRQDMIFLQLKPPVMNDSDDDDD